MNEHQPFGQELCELVAMHGYTYQALMNLIRLPDEELTDEGRWVKMVCVQAAMEHIERHN